MYRTSDSSSSGHASSSPAVKAVSRLPEALPLPLLLARSSITVTTRRCLRGRGSRSRFEYWVQLRGFAAELLCPNAGWNTSKTKSAGKLAQHKANAQIFTHRARKRSSLSSVATGKQVEWRKLGSRTPCTTEVNTSWNPRS